MAKAVKDSNIWKKAQDLEIQSVKDYNALYKAVESEINDFFSRPSSYQTNNMSSAELNRFRKLLNKAKKLATKLKDREFHAKVSSLLNRVSVKRREGLFTSIEYKISELTDSLIEDLDFLYTDAIKESYKSGLKLTGNEPYEKEPTTIAIKRIKNQEYAGATFDVFVKDRKGTYYKNFEKILVTSLLANRSKTAVLKDFQKLTKRQKQYTKMWIRNQVSFALNLSSKEAYEDSGYEKYQFNAVLDARTTEICRSLDGKVFYLKDGVPGVNMPPMYPPPHPCRSFITPYGESENG